MSSLTRVILLALSALVVLQSLAWCETTTLTPTSTEAPKGSECSEHNDQCSPCVSNASCYYCWKTSKCNPYPYQILHPVPEECGDSLDDLSWRTCKVNARTLVIVFGSLFGAFGLISLILLVYCCWIRDCMKKSYENQIVRWDRSRLQMEARQAERRQEREHARAAIKAKYGLGEGPDYKRF